MLTIRKLLISVALVAPACLGAQSVPGTGTRPSTLAIDVGSETENYLRYLQAAGEAPLIQWSIRGFSPIELASLMTGADVASRLRSFEHPVHTTEDAQWQIVPFVLDNWYNTGFPFGQNDGAVWRGRGLTTAARGGIALRYGILSVQLQPVAFVAQNGAFPLMPNGQTGALEYADALRPRLIDRPQRFGADAYAALDPGQSTVRLDAFGVAVGLSTANQWWGPMSDWPFLLGNNAAGFPHVFAGTSQAVSVGLGRIQGRVVYGRLEQSAFTDITGAAQHRLLAGAIASFTPRGVDGLELGAARLFHQPWPSGGIGWEQLKKPFEGFLKATIAGGTGPQTGTPDNQLLSFFMRWVFPANGLEVYGEFGRDDHNRDTRDFLEEPDHDATLGLGFRKSWRRSDGALSGLRAELFDLDPSILGRNRGQGTKYAHTEVRQGHTERGQVLGAGFAAVNGAGSELVYERFSGKDGKLLLSLSRMVVRERDDTASQPGAVDVQYSLAAERTRRVGAVGITWGLTGVYEMDRYFAADVGNLMGSIRIVW